LIEKVTVKFSSSSTTLFNDVPKIMSICLLYISIKYCGLYTTMLIFITFLLADMAFKILAWVAVKMINNFGWIVQAGKANKKEKKKFRGAVSSFISVSVTFGLLSSLIMLFALLSFFSLLDLNELRKDIKFEYLLDDNAMVSERLDSAVKPYLKKFLKIVDHHTDIPYKFNRQKFQNMTTLQVINDFSSVANITSASDFLGLVKNVVIEEPLKSDNPDIDDGEFEDNTYYQRVGEKIYAIVGDISRDKYSIGVNTTKIYDTSIVVVSYTVSVVLELANYSFYFIIFLSVCNLLVSMDKDIVHYGVAYLPINDQDYKEKFVRSLIKTIKGIFLSPIKISITLSTVSWVILDFFGVKYLYIYSFLATIMTFLPLIQPSILGVPAALYLYFVEGHDWLWALSCFLVYYIITSRIFTDIYSNELSSINRFLLFISLVNGLYVFDVKGFVYGPILICLIQAAIELIKPPTHPTASPNVSK
jgi:hypothetical protein